MTSTRSAAAALLLLSLPLFGAEGLGPALKLGDTLRDLTLRGKLRSEARLRHVATDRIMFECEGALLSVTWQELPESLQAELRPLIQRERKLPPTTPTPLPRVARKVAPESEKNEAEIGKLELKPAVDFRPEMRHYGLWVKDQGTRPSCAVYAVLSSLEYQQVKMHQRAIRFNEDAVLRAVEHLTGRPALHGDSGADAGYTLVDVAEAIRRSGIDGTQDAGAEPGQKPFVPAQQRMKFGVIQHRRDGADLGALIQALNAGVSIPIALNWPYPAATHGGLIDTQDPQPNYHHAVALVGYECPTGRIEDTVFLFKNSWGVRWGSSGFGRVTYSYLLRNLHYALIAHLEETPTEE